VDNNTNYTYTIKIYKSSDGTNPVSNFTLKKNKSSSMTLPPGTYNIVATSSGQPTRTGTFTLPTSNPNDTLVLQILSIGN
jgi:hypothetical protein